MTVIEFINNINHTNDCMADNLKVFFIQFMGLYTTLNSWQIWVDVTSRVEDNNLIYTLRLKDKKDIDRFVSVLNSTPITMYGTSFNIKTIRQGDLVDIFLTKKASA